MEDLTRCLAVAYILRLYLISRVVCWNMWTEESLHFGLMSHWNGNDQKCRNEPPDYQNHDIPVWPLFLPLVLLPVKNRKRELLSVSL